MIDTHEITAALTAELLAIQDYNPPSEIATAQAQVVRRIAAGFILNGGR